MTHLLATLPDPYPRCPGCSAVAYPWPTEHRAGCAYTHTDPTTWRTDD